MATLFTCNVGANIKENMLRQFNFVLLFVGLGLAFLITIIVKSKPNESYGDLHFTKSIALIELYHTMHGYYPDKLEDIEYGVMTAKGSFSSVRYLKLDGGYQLDLVDGWFGIPRNLCYPDEFWRGLGCKISNLK